MVTTKFHSCLETAIMEEKCVPVVSEYLELYDFINRKYHKPNKNSRPGGTAMLHVGFWVAPHVVQTAKRALSDRPLTVLQSTDTH